MILNLYIHQKIFTEPLEGLTSKNLSLEHPWIFWGKESDANIYKKY